MNVFRTLKKRANLIASCERGVAMLEFAVSVSLLLIMFFGAIEVSRYILIVQKVEKTVDTITDLFTQAETANITQSTVNDYLNAAPLLMSPYSMGSSGVVIFTDVAISNTGVATVNWQVCGGGSDPATSQVAPSSAQGSTATLPAGFSPTPGQADEVVIGEMFYNVTPIFVNDVVSAIPIYRVAVFRPRFSSDLTATSQPCS